RFDLCATQACRCRRARRRAPPSANRRAPTAGGFALCGIEKQDRPVDTTRARDSLRGEKLFVPPALSAFPAARAPACGGGGAAPAGDNLPAGRVEILPGKAVVEVKPARVSKALAVAELMMHPPFHKRHPIFIGDDFTDEPVFPVISQFGGLGFSVGRVVAGVECHFKSPEDVRAWLDQIVANRGDAVG